MKALRWALATLLLLTAASFAAARLHLFAWELPVALCIATCKAGIIARYFLQVHKQGPSTALAMIVALTLVVAFIALAMVEALTRVFS